MVHKLLFIIYGPFGLTGRRELILFSGKSEVEKDQCGFKVFSTHVWTKEIEVPENVKPETIKAKMSAENILKITAERKDDHNIDIEIPNLD